MFELIMKALMVASGVAIFFALGALFADYLESVSYRKRNKGKGNDHV